MVDMRWIRYGGTNCGLWHLTFDVTGIVVIILNCAGCVKVSLLKAPWWGFDDRTGLIGCRRGQAHVGAIYSRQEKTTSRANEEPQRRLLTLKIWTATSYFLEFNV